MGKNISIGAEKAPSRASLNAIGHGISDIEKPLIGIISAFNGATPLNSALSLTTDMLRTGITAAGGTAIVLPCPSVCESMSTGYETSGLSLAARETIADCVEMLFKSHPLDAAVLVPSGDLVCAAMLMGAARADIPVLVCSGGAETPAIFGGKRTTLIDIYETMGKVASGKGSSAELEELEGVSASGSYGESYSHSTFGCLTEALGIALVGNGTIVANTVNRKKFAKNAGGFMLTLLEKNLVIKKIITADAIKNALALNLALGGSTNNILHLLALAAELRLKVTMADVEKLSQTTPVLVSLAPVGNTFVADLESAGGVPALLGELCKSNLIKKTPLTVSGTMDELIGECVSTDTNIIKNIGEPYVAQNIYVLKGSLAEDGCIAKVPVGFNNLKFTGSARVFNTIEECSQAIRQKKIKAGDCLIIRYLGARAAGMKEVSLPAAMLFGAGLHETVAIVTDGRIPEGVRCLAVGHVTPEAELGDTLALVEDGDKLEIDLVKNKINVFISSKDLNTRRKKWKPRDITAKGALLRYTAHVTDANSGAGVQTKV